MTWSEIPEVLEEQFAEAAPEVLFQAMDVKQKRKQSIDQYALTLDQAYEGIPLWNE